MPLKDTVSVSECLQMLSAVTGRDCVTPKWGHSHCAAPKGLRATLEGFPENDVVPTAAIAAAFLCAIIELISSLSLVYSRPRDQIIPLV